MADGAPGNTAPAGLTEDQVTDLVMKVVNGAISSRDKMADKKREQDKLEFKKMIEETLAAAKPAAAAAEDLAAGAKGKKDVEIETLKKRLEEVSRQAEATDKARAEERAKNRQVTLRQKVVDALAAHQIEGIRAKGALACLNDESRVKFADDSSDDIVFRNDDGNDVDLPVGLQSWVKSDQAKLFIPPSGARGSGSRNNGALPLGVSKEEAVSQFWETLGHSVRSG